MSVARIIVRGVDALVLNVCYADKQFQPIKQELDADLQEELNSQQGEACIKESTVVMQWVFKGFNLFMNEKGSRGQWRWILTDLSSGQAGNLAWLAQSHHCAIVPLL